MLRLVSICAGRFFSTKFKLNKRYDKEVLNKFDKMYRNLYGEKWTMIRQALLTKHNYIALMNNFSSHTDITDHLESNCAINLHQHFKLRQNDRKVSLIESTNEGNVFLPDVKLHIYFEPEKILSIPKNLNIYTISGGNIHNFPQPKYCEFTNTFSHILLNGASFLPAVALDVQQGECVLDACSGPGTKALILLQISHSIRLICNEIDEKRKEKLENLLKYYTIDCDRNKMYSVTHGDISECTEYGKYDKILVDVPCSTDRHRIQQFKHQHNEIFNLSESDLIALQTKILVNCIRLLKPGGSLVYSTCSLNPKENDEVVEAAVIKSLSEYGVATKIRNMSEAIQPFKEIFEFEGSDRLKYGQLVVPTVQLNYGPMYFCKIVRDR